MRFAINSNFQGFTVAEYVDMKSKNSTIKLDGEVKAKWVDNNMKSTPEATAMRFMTEFGKSMKKKYDSKYKTWVSNVQKALNSLETSLAMKQAKFEKSSKKKPVSEAVKQAFETQLNAEKDTGTNQIKKDAQTSYTTMLSDLLATVRSATLKSMGKEGKLFNTGHGAFVWNVLKFAVVAAMIVVAVVTFPTGVGAAAIAVGVAGLITKGLTSTTSFVKDCIEYNKRYNTAVTKVAKNVDGAVDVIDSAIADLRQAQNARDAIIVNLAKAQRKVDEATGRGAKAAEMKKANDKLKKVQESMKNFEKTLGGEPLAVASELENVRAAIKKARGNIPVVTKSGAGSIGDILGKLDDAVSMADEVLGGL